MSQDRFILPGLLILALSGCGTTRRFVDEPPLTIDGSGGSAHEVAAALFDGRTPYKVNLCEADPASHECRKGSDGIKANGLGGRGLGAIQG